MKTLWIITIASCALILMGCTVGYVVAYLEKAFDGWCDID